MAQASNDFVLHLNDEERTELLKLLDHYLVETHMENRRTDNLDYRAELRHEENVLKTLLEKVRRLGA